MATARLSDVDAWRAAERPGPTRSRVVWGPVDAAAAALAGCARGVESLCIVPRLTPFLVAAALGCIPHDVRAKCTDTADVLAERLGRSGFLDDAHVLRGGNGKRKRGQSMRVRLNETTYPAPRRKSWSVVVEGDPDGDAVALFNYNAYGRTSGDVRCTAMPQPIFNLGVELWLAAMPHLCEASRAAPPTHCQLLLYYTLFNSAIGESAHCCSASTMYPNTRRSPFIWCALSCRSTPRQLHNQAHTGRAGGRGRGGGFHTRRSGELAAATTTTRQ